MEFVLIHDETSSKYNGPDATLAAPYVKQSVSGMVVVVVVAVLVLVLVVYCCCCLLLLFIVVAVVVVVVIADEKGKIFSEHKP
jgi:hypothetical protein